jgi:alpha-1,4-digalacturonate transport system substrate-binding protein
MNRRISLTSGVALAAMAWSAAAAAQTELRYTCYGDGNECEVSRDILDRFEAENPDIKVTVDQVPYKAILESLPVQLAAGEGPDLARVTDLGGLNKYYLDIAPYVDAAYWEDNFGKTLDWYRGDPDDDGIYGMMTQLTITGPYINKTLFDQAGVEVPASPVTSISRQPSAPLLMNNGRCAGTPRSRAIMSGRSSRLRGVPEASLGWRNCPNSTPPLSSKR